VQCANCGYEAREPSRFCARCGQPHAQPATASDAPAPDPGAVPPAPEPAQPWGVPADGPSAQQPYVPPPPPPPNPQYGSPPGPYSSPPGAYAPPPDPYAAQQNPYAAPPNPYAAPPNPYGAPPGYGYGYGQTSATNGLAVASLILGIVGWVACGVGSVLAIILGIVARSQIRASGGRQGGDGMAKAGIILGCVFVALFVAYLVAAFAISVANTSN
jgi:hypothetical protein